MQLSPILLALAAVATVVAAPAPGELAARTPEALADPEDQSLPNADWERGAPDWKRGAPDWKRGAPDWKRGAPDWKRGAPDWKRGAPDWKRGAPDWKRD